MLNQKDLVEQKRKIPYLNAEAKQAIGANFDEFSYKFKWLQDTWAKWSNTIGDSNELRLISSILFQKSIPINISIIADNIEYFQNHYQERYENHLEKALQLACLCGSQKIAEFLLEKLNINYASEDYDFILSYVSASMNEDWIKEIALAMKQANKNIPDKVYLFADLETLNTLKAIFKKIPSL